MENYILRFTLFKKNTAVQEQNSVCNLSCKAHFVGNDDAGHAVLNEVIDDVFDFIDHGGIKCARGLVEQHDVGMHRKRTGDRHSLLLTAGERIGHTVFIPQQPDLLQKLAYGPESSLPWQELFKKEPKANQLYRFSWKGAADKERICARYDEESGRVKLVKTREAYGIRPRNDEQKLALDACLNKDVKLVALTGGAGTGKTLLALAAALEQEKEFYKTAEPYFLKVKELEPNETKKWAISLYTIYYKLNNSKELSKIEAVLKSEGLL